MSRRYDTPDHGQNFVPGAESAPNLAPGPLDHFKRGYQERADMRDRDGESIHRSSRISSGADNGRSSFQDEARRSSEHRGSFQQRSSFQQRESFQSRTSNRGSVSSNRGSFYEDRRSSSYGGGDRDGRRGGPGHQQIINGLNIQNLVDSLSHQNANVANVLDAAREEYYSVFASGKAITAVISHLARRRNLRLAMAVWDWVDSVGIQKNTFHYNSMISACEKVRDYRKALGLLDEMKAKGVTKNEVTFSSAISACEKCGQWRTALELLDQMKKEGSGQTAIAYNAAISACEKGLVPHKAIEIFEQMKREGVEPTVVTYSALISAAEKGQQWKLALEILEEMKAAGHGANVIAYSAAISALSKGQQWAKALQLFREIEATGGKPSIVTYNATMTALEKGLEWERALDLFDEMKMKNMPVTVVSYGSAISACEKGLQYRQCLEYLDEMTEMGIKKNVIIFGAAMSCMEKSCRADIAFQLMDRMKIEEVQANVHIYNSAISACARCSLWEKGYELFQEMERVGVARDVVTYNAVLDSVCSEVELGRKLFKEGVERGFYSRVSRLGTQWLELDLHFLSLGGGEIALGWWFEECLVPYLVNTSKLETIQTISIVTGYGKTRTRGSRANDDGMRLRVGAMLKFMNIKEKPQDNKGRIHVDKDALINEVKRNGGRIVFDLEGYTRFKEEATTANKYPNVPQKVRARFRPAQPGEGPPGTFVREGVAEVQEGYDQHANSRSTGDKQRGQRWEEAPRQRESFPQERRRSSHQSSDPGWRREQRGGYEEHSANSDGYRDDRRVGYGERRPDYHEHSRRRGDVDRECGDRRPSYADHDGSRGSYGDEPGAGRSSFHDGLRRGNQREWESRGSFEQRTGGDRDLTFGRDRHSRDEYVADRHSDFSLPNARDHPYRGDPPSRQVDSNSNNCGGRNHRMDDRPDDYARRPSTSREGDYYHGGESGRGRSSYNHQPAQNRSSYSDPIPNGNDRHGGYSDRDHTRSNMMIAVAAVKSDPTFYEGDYEGNQRQRGSYNEGTYYNNDQNHSFPDKDDRKIPAVKEEPYDGNYKKRDYDEYSSRNQSNARGYNIEPAFSKRRSA